MLNSAQKIATAVALTGALAVAAATPSQAQWYGWGWGWGAPVVAAPAYYGGYYVYPVYGYSYGWGYPAYAYGYGGPTYATYAIVGYRVPAGYVSPSYGYYTYASPSYEIYRQARHYVAGPTYAKARKYTAERSYVMAPRGQHYSHIYRTSSGMVGIAANSRLIHTATVVPRKRAIGGHRVTGVHVSQNVGVRAVNASVGDIR